MQQLKDDGKKVDHPPITGCFTSDTKIKLVDGRDLSISDLLKEQSYKTNYAKGKNYNDSVKITDEYFDLYAAVLGMKKN